MSDADRICTIFAAGEYYDERPSVPAGALVIAADGGLDHTRALGITPDVIVGDFDSVEGGLREVTGTPDSSTCASGTTARTIALPPLKDDPDLLSALKIGWSASRRIFHIWGGLGGRVDHTISNIQLMALLAKHGGTGYLHGDGTVVTSICDGRLSFPAHRVRESGRMVSVFSHSDVSRDVNEIGFKYELRHGDLANTVVQGVSNEFRDGVPASIAVQRGTLIVTFPAEVPTPGVSRFHGFTGDLGALDTEISKSLVS